MNKGREMRTNKIEHIIINEMELEHIFKKDDLFYSKSWRKAIINGFGCESFGILSSFKGENVLLGIYFQTTKGFIKLVGAPLPGTFTPYLDPIWLVEVEDEIKKEVFASQFNYLKKMGFSYIEYRFENYEDAKLLNEQVNIDLIKPQTYMLKIEDDIEQNWKNLKSVCRRNIRKAQKSDVILERFEACELDVEDYYEILKVVFKKSDQNPPHSLKFFKEIVYRMQEDQKLLFLRALLNNEIIAMIIFLYDKEKLLFLSSASLPLAYKYAVNNLMQWEGIKFAHEKGIKYYNLNGKGVPTIDRFKESFGSYVHSYGKLSYKTSIARGAEFIYKKVKKVGK